VEVNLAKANELCAETGDVAAAILIAVCEMILVFGIKVAAMIQQLCFCLEYRGVEVHVPKPAIGRKGSLSSHLAR
jgi:hypothetical protein